MRVYALTFIVVILILYTIMGFVYGSTFRLDGNGDIVLTPANDVSLVTEHEKVVQDITVMLRSQKNQYLFSKKYGIDYKQYLTDKNLNSLVNVDIMNALSNYYFVDAVDSLLANQSGHNLNINAELTLINGDKITIQVTI